LLTDTYSITRDRRPLTTDRQHLAYQSQLVLWWSVVCRPRSGC